MKALGLDVGLDFHGRVHKPMARQLIAALEPLRSFILPGGSALSAHLHLSRTVARRAERCVTALATTDAVNPAALRYLNRLSDWLFVAARHANLDAGGDILWVPGASR